MAKSTVRELSALVRKLQSERQEHIRAVDGIDQMFAQLGISALMSARRGRKPGRPKGTTAPKTTEKAAKKVAQKAAPKVAKRGKRGSYKTTAAGFILGLLAGGTVLTTAQIIAQWREAGRGGKPDNALTKLVKDQKVQRDNIKGGRGSMYKAA